MLCSEDSALSARQELDRERSKHHIDPHQLKADSESASIDDPQCGASNSRGDMAAQRLDRVEHELDLSQEQLQVCACLTVSFCCSSLSVHSSQRPKF